MSERESWVKIHIWWDPSERVGTQHETLILSTVWTQRQVHKQKPRLHEESQRNAFLENSFQTWSWADHSEDVGRAVNKNSNVEQGQCEPCFWSEGTQIPSVVREQQTRPRWDSKWIPAPEDACDSSTVTWDRLCSRCSPQTIFCCSLRCFFPLKLTEKWAVPQHIFQVRHRFRMFSLKTANDCFQLGLTKASFLCCFFILHETAQIKCSMKEWNDLICHWWCSLTTSNF